MSDRSRNDVLDEIAHEKARLADLDGQRERARRRVVDLQAELAAASMPGASNSQAAPLPVVRETAVPRAASEKVFLFRELFRGRMDVFPKRWVNAKKGTKG